MKRTLNWTHRRTIPLDGIRIRLRTPSNTEDVADFTADLTGLQELGLKPDARIYIEPYFKSSSMRFDFGSVSDLRSPADTRLTELDRGDGILFRVKVVEESEGVGRIVASANAVRPEGEVDADDRKALLPVTYRDLGEAIWQLDAPRGARPVLALNSRIPALGDRLRDDPIFQGAVIPHALMVVLRVVFGDDADDDEEWVKDWKAFVATIRNGQEIDADADEESLEQALEDVVHRFIEETAWVKTYKQLQEKAAGVIHD